MKWLTLGLGHVEVKSRCITRVLTYKTCELPGKALIKSRVSHLAYIIQSCNHLSGPRKEKERKVFLQTSRVCVCGMIELPISSSCKLLVYLLSFCQRTLRFLVTPVTGSNQECEVKLLANATEWYISRTYVRSATLYSRYVGVTPSTSRVLQLLPNRFTQRNS